MRFKTLVLCGFSVLLLSAPAAATAAPCCEKAVMPCCDKADMACCEKDVDAVGILMNLDPVNVAEAPARQLTEVWFMRPVIVDRHILQGRYVIEHDNDRMARGEPCTYIYAYNDQKHPVVTFHCKHLVRDEATANTVTMASTADGWQKLLEFQFKGETASHGVPTVR